MSAIPVSREAERGHLTIGSLAPWAAPALGLLVPFVSFLRFHDYDLLRPESLLCIGLLCAIGLALSAIAALRPIPLRHVAIALVVAIFVDTQLTLQGQLAPLRRLDLSVEFLSVIVNVVFPLNFLAALIVTRIIRSHLDAIAAAVFGVMLVVSIFVAPSPSSTTKVGEPSDQLPGSHLPPIVHLVLDEQIGIEGLPTDQPGGRELRAELSAIYQDYGFRLYGRAFSHYARTLDSLGNLLNGSASSRHGAHLLANVEGHKIDRNAWFHRLSEQGYRLRVIQTDYLDFCASPEVAVERCTVFRSHFLGSAMESGLDIGDKAKLIMEYFFLDTSFSLMVAGMEAWFTPEASIGDPSLARPFWRVKPPPLGPVTAASDGIDLLIDELRDAKRGTAYFAHLLLPHFGYVFDSDCGFSADYAEWLNNHNKEPRLQPNGYNTEVSRSRRYQRYFEQVRCTHVRLREVFDAMRQGGVLDEAIVIVHGDHGSRISLLEPTVANAERLSARDVIDNYSSLFALKSPDTDAGYDPAFRSIQGLFSELLLRDPLSNEHGNIYLRPRLPQSETPFGARPMAAFPP